MIIIFFISFIWHVNNVAGKLYRVKSVMTCSRPRKGHVELKIGDD